MIQYADDTTLFVKSKSKPDLEINSFVDLNSCIQFFSEINLKTNNAKSNAISFCLRPQEADLLPIVMVDEDLLELTDSTKFLGMILDRGLTWSDHVDQVCSKVTSGIFALRNLAKVCPRNILLMAYYGLIYPYLAYGIRLWGGCAKHKLERVFRLQKRAIRVIFNLQPRESCRDAFRELDLLTLPSLYIFYVVVYCRAECSLTQGSQIHNYNTRGRDCYRVQQHRMQHVRACPHSLA